jgi:hypothetical protein
MSCSYRQKKPALTRTMKEKDQVYIWKTLRDNPNLFCWVPASMRTVEPGDISLEDINIQDIPPLQEPKSEDIILAEMQERAEKVTEMVLRKKVKDGTDPVSSDHPAKYKFVREFLSTLKVILYGGAAINAYMPRDHKIYKSSAIPDYDVYSSTPWTDATALADFMHSKGYEICEAKSGIHKGTYKVFVDLWPVADITYLHPEIMEVLKTKKINGLNVIPVSEVQSAMYRQLSLPNQTDRWEKVYTRQKVFTEEVNPLGNRKLNCNKFERPGIPLNVETLISLCYTECENKNLISGGDIAYNTYVTVGGGTTMVPIENLRYFSTNSHKDISDIFTTLLKLGVHSDMLNLSTAYSPLRPINTHSYDLEYTDNETQYTILSIVSLDVCIAYKNVLSTRVVSIDFLKYELYLDLAYKQNKHDTKCMIKYITILQNTYYNEKNITEFDNSPFQRLVSRCEGPLENPVKREMLKRWVDRIEGRDRVKVIKPTSDSIVLSNVKGTTIRIYPSDAIPEDCLDKSEKDCEYPCYWNKKHNRCFGHPQGVYIAGQQEIRPLEEEDDQDGKDWYPEYKV